MLREKVARALMKTADLFSSVAYVLAPPKSAEDLGSIKGVAEEGESLTGVVVTPEAEAMLAKAQPKAPEPQPRHPRGSIGDRMRAADLELQQARGRFDEFHSEVSAKLRNKLS